MPPISVLLQLFTWTRCWGRASGGAAAFLGGSWVSQPLLRESRNLSVLATSSPATPVCPAQLGAHTTTPLASRLPLSLFHQSRVGNQLGRAGEDCWCFLATVPPPPNHHWAKPFSDKPAKASLAAPVGPESGDTQVSRERRRGH